MTSPSDRPSLEDIVDELARVWALRGRLVDRLRKANEALAKAGARVGRVNAELADVDALVNELRARASAGALGLDRRVE